MILHAIDPSNDGATELTIHSPDTDVLCCSSLVTGKGTIHRCIKLGPIANALCLARAAALPAFYALTGADNTRCFGGKGKLKCWKEFEDCDNSILNALSNLGQEKPPDAVVKDAIKKFVCSKTNITTVQQLRWSICRKKPAESEKLPLTQAALHETLLCANF